MKFIIMQNDPKYNATTWMNEWECIFSYKKKIKESLLYLYLPTNRKMFITKINVFQIKKDKMKIQNENLLYFWITLKPKINKSF